MNHLSARLELESALQASRSHGRLIDFVRASDGTAVVIYGAGYSGRFACDILLRNGIMPRVFFDEKAETERSYGGIQIATLAQDPLTADERARATVILCVLAKVDVENAIIDNLKSGGYSRIFPFKQKAFSSDYLKRDDVDAFEPELYNFRDRIVKCAELFADTLSLDTYTRNMEAFCRRDFSNVPYLPVAQQYLPPDISFSKGYSRFVDCGAFDGDTLASLVRHGHTPEIVVAFEPDPRNYAAMCRRVADLRLRNCVLLPCGVSSATETLTFKHDLTYAGAASTIDPNGNHVIQCVAIDDALKGINPTFIKMDIEGAEIGALHGARRTIEECRPDLAICIYHYVDHYFEIPLLLHAWNPRYQFYLRTYDRNGNETVVYAIDPTDGRLMQGL